MSTGRFQILNRVFDPREECIWSTRIMNDGSSKMKAWRSAKRHKEVRAEPFVLVDPLIQFEPLSDYKSDLKGSTGLNQSPITMRLEAFVPLESDCQFSTLIPNHLVSLFERPPTFKSGSSGLRGECTLPGVPQSRIGTYTFDTPQLGRPLRCGARRLQHTT
jgi:hypothetical protein